MKTLKKITTLFEAQNNRNFICEGIESVAFSPDSKYALAGSRNGTTMLFDIKERKIIAIFKQPRKYGQFGNVLTSVVTSVAFSPDGKYALTGSLHNAIVWNLSLPKLSLEELVLVLKLYNLKIAGSNLSELFNYPIFKEIFDNIADKDEVLGALTKDLELDCAICLDKLGEDRAKQKCGHNQFHFACIEQWKEIQGEQKTCPICRKEL